MLSLPSLPPPPSSLLPPLTHTPDPFTPHTHHPHHIHPHHQRRPKNHLNPRATLPTLTSEERLLSSRKTAIAMYGFSWLRPAGCAKTMLGMREEEREREEVEKQLREVEVQERMAVEVEEGEWREGQREMRELGEVVNDGERDLDDDVPDAGAAEEMDDVGEGGDLDDEIPDADVELESGEDEDDGDDEDEEEEEEDDGAHHTSGFEEGWTYDSRREPDTPSEPSEADEDAVIDAHLAATTGRFAHLLPQNQQRQSQAQRRIDRTTVARAASHLAIGGDYGFDVDEREAAELADAMLDEDELGEMDDDYVGAADEDVLTAGGGRDLDDDVPSADEGGWEHTDTELEEESEMDVSILPAATATTITSTATSAATAPGGRRSSGLPSHPDSARESRSRTTRTGARVISGNMVQVLRAQQEQRMAQQEQQLQQPLQGQRLGHGQRQGNMGVVQSVSTPSLDHANTSALLSSSSIMEIDDISAVNIRAAEENVAATQDNGRNWLDVSSARRNLFGSRLGTGTGMGMAGGGSAGRGRAVGGGGGLFTPSPRQEQLEEEGLREEDDGDGAVLGEGEGYRRRRRSGRLLSATGMGTGMGMGRRRENRDSVD